MKKDEVKLTTDEVSEILELNNEYQNILINFGQLHLQKIHLEKELKNISKLEDEYHISYAEIEKQEKNFKDRITRKYGEGEINLESGIYHQKIK
jgi:hypothetical protein